MGNAFAPVGAALPRRRDELMLAAGSVPEPVPASEGVTIDVSDARGRVADLLIAAAHDAKASGRLSESFVIPESRDRMLEMIEREQLPTEVRSTLVGSLMGDLQRQQLLFQAMIDTWPRLQKCLREVKLAARKAPWKVVPYKKRREKKPDAAAEKLAGEVEDAVWAMKPDMIRGYQGFEGMVEELALAYFLGHQVLEIHWEKGEEGWAPKCAKVVPPRFYGYPAFEEGEDRLMLDKEGGRSGSLNYEDFPPNKFLVAVNGGHPGHPTIAAPLRALTGYWLGAIYGLKWLMQYAQLFGVPFRWAEYPTGAATAKTEVANMLRRIGSEGWGAFPAGTKLQFVESSKGGGSSLVQRELITLADEQCAEFILGQNLTSASGDKGARSLGEVHLDVRKELLDGVCEFVGEVLTYQLSPAIVEVNYGDSRPDVPEIRAVFEDPKDEMGMAERDNALGITTGKVPVGKEWFYERHGIPIPAEGEEIYEPTPDPEPEQVGPDGKPLPPAKQPKPGEKKPAKEEQPKKEKVEAADSSLTWRQFPATMNSLGIPRAEMPQIKSGDRASMVQFFRARGIGCREEIVQADTLRPTQAEYSPEKALATSKHGGDRAIIISEDGYVVDGHHQWWDAAMMQRDIKVLRLLAPIERCLMMAHRMPSTTVAASIREDLDDGAPDLKKLVHRMAKAVEEGSIVDADDLADLLGAQWINAAKEAPND